MSAPTTLLCHAETPTAVVQRIDVEARRGEGGRLWVRFCIEGALDRIRVPAKSAPAIALDLWQHTCCEAFIALDGVDAYHELNLSPSRHWAVFAFDRYREGITVLDETHAPQVDVRVGLQSLEIEAIVPVERLSRRHAEGPLRIALSAVVEDESGGLSYWALHHPPGVADFHHPDAFALRLEPAA